MEKRGPFTIKELRTLSPGTQFWGKYLILDKNQRKIKDGRDIINLKLGDTTGEIDVVVWDNCKVTGELENGAVIGLLADVGSYNNRLQATAKRIKILEEDPLEYVKKPNVDIDTLIEQFEDIRNRVSDPCLQELLTRILTPEVRNTFFLAPAAKKIHHNYSGGLLEHTLNVAKLCTKAADNYPDLNRDLLISGALLHDIGKLQEYELKVVPEYTVEGRLLGHIVMGSELITAQIAQMRAENLDFPPKLEWMLKHMILSHHGSLEFGSPVIPLFPEAFMLYMMDNLDAKMFVYKQKIDENDRPDELFTNYDTFFGQHFFTYRYHSGKEE
ncbi:MAG: HD domain-containing protein [Syntrophomonadaceae bacterium]|nr:HD domain-containing protein [Syntrophomonadaceae bacterium]